MSGNSCEINFGRSSSRAWGRCQDLQRFDRIAFERSALPEDDRHFDNSISATQNAFKKLRADHVGWDNAFQRDKEQSEEEAADEDETQDLTSTRRKQDGLVNNLHAISICVR